MRDPITIKTRGNFKNFNSFLERSKNLFNVGVLDKYGRMGVEALKEATPKDTSRTSDAWSYKIVRTGNTVTLEFHNSNIQNGYNVAVLLYLGHATKSGYWVQGVDYINPALKPVFNELAKNALKEATE